MKSLSLVKMVYEEEVRQGLPKGALEKRYQRRRKLGQLKGSKIAMSPLFFTSHPQTGSLKKSW
jgi:hypothetical protein